MKTYTPDPERCGGALRIIAEIALVVAVAVWLGWQARREVDQRKLPVPAMDDGQWTSAIEQVSDKSISVCRPRKYRLEGETFGEKNAVMVQGENQMVVVLLKQKLGVANKSYWVMFNPIYNRLDEAEMKHVDLNNLGSLS
jgi:hypothetical protein